MISAQVFAVVLQAIGYLPAGHRWASGSLPAPYCITPNATHTGLAQTALHNDVISAINQWRNTSQGGGISCTTYDAIPSTAACSPVQSGSDGVNNIFWQSNWTLGSQVIGVTISTFGGSCGTLTDGTGRMWNLSCTQDADIQFNDRDYTWTDDGTGTDVGSIAVHEYGHFIGLDHCNNNNTCNLGTAVMYAAYAGGEIRVPFNDDVTGACALYPGTMGGIGWPCSATGQCTSGLCVNPTQGGYCSQTCGACPTGYLCGANPQNTAQQVCIKDDGLNHALCQTCSGLPNSCANGGQCVSGIPEPTSGRCVTPCPNPAAMDGACPMYYGCYQRQGDPNHYCVPKSQDCTNLMHFSQLMLGQNCDPTMATVQCATGLDCIGICSMTCTGAPNQGSCPAGYACATFNFQGGMMMSYCAPPVNEGENCSGTKACPVGPCLTNAQGIYLCYRDCSANPNICNNAQTCLAVMVQGAGVDHICDPPGVPPNRDAGVIDTGVSPPDAAQSMDDSGSASIDSGSTASDASAGVDASSSATDASVECACDTTFGCDPGCNCDPNCVCACDQTYGCDPGCSCDPDCKKGSSCGCTMAVNPRNEIGATTDEGWSLLIGLLLFGLLGTKRFMR
jgi:hypothetical protein